MQSIERRRQLQDQADRIIERKSAALVQAHGQARSWHVLAREPDTTVRFPFFQYRWQLQMYQALLLTQVPPMARALGWVSAEISGQHLEHELRAKLIFDASRSVDQIERAGAAARERQALWEALLELTGERLEQCVDRAALVLRADGLIV
jgi:hypothetical protein